MPAQPARFSTLGLSEAQRSARWEEWNRGALVGLTCRTPDGRGLRGEEVTLDLGELTLGHVQAERHRIARTSATVDASPTGSLVVYAVLRGRTTFSDGTGSWTVPAGDAVIVDADRPFERTFPTGFAELAIKLPRPRLRGLRGADARGGARFVRASGLAALRVRTLAHQVTRSTLPLDPGDAETLTQVALDLVDDLTVGGGIGGRLPLARLLVEQHLNDPTLSAPRLAGALQISERQLSRLFAGAQTTFPKQLTERRLRRAAALLRTSPTLPIGEIAVRCGFASPAYFSRVFRDRHGMSAQQFRERGLHFSAITTP